MSEIMTILDHPRRLPPKPQLRRSQIEHSRHRSPINALINIICWLIAYCHQPKKPSLTMEWALPSVS
jgi:hypothetical protein